MKTESENKSRAAESFFLEWYNDFLTVKRFAEYHGMPENEALELIEQGRIEHKYRTRSN